MEDRIEEVDSEEGNLRFRVLLAGGPERGEIFSSNTDSLLFLKANNVFGFLSELKLLPNPSWERSRRLPLPGSTIAEAKNPKLKKLVLRPWKRDISNFMKSSF